MLLLMFLPAKGIMLPNFRPRPPSPAFLPRSPPMAEENDELQALRESTLAPVTVDEVDAFLAFRTSTKPSTSKGSLENSAEKTFFINHCAVAYIPPAERVESSPFAPTPPGGVFAARPLLKEFEEVRVMDCLLSRIRAR